MVPSSRRRPAGNYTVEISIGGQRCWLGTFDTRHEAACAYDIVLWWFGQLRCLLRFPEIPNREMTEMLAPPLRLVSVEDERRNARTVQQLLVVEADEHCMVEWRWLHPENVEYENNYWTKKKTEQWAANRAAKTFSDEHYRLMELGLPSIPENDDYWLDTFPIDAEETCDRINFSVSVLVYC
jgi:hypothetical protein